MVWLWLGGLTGALGYLARWVWVLKHECDALYQQVDVLTERRRAARLHAIEPRRTAVGIFNDGG